MSGGPSRSRNASTVEAAEIVIQVNGRPIAARSHQTVLAALVAAGFKKLRNSQRLGEARGFLCGMGVCYECLVTIDGVPRQRACMTEVADRMEIGIDE